MPIIGTTRSAPTDELNERLAPIVSRLWLLGGTQAPGPAERLAAGIVVAPLQPADDEQSMRPALGVGLLLH